MTNEITGVSSTYSGKAKEVVHAEISLPENAPAWAVERYSGQGEDGNRASERLMNDVEIRENASKRSATAQLLNTLILALPAELSRDQQVALMRQFVAAELTSKGAIADWVIHDKKDGNPHAHVQSTMRDLTPEGFGRKFRGYMTRSQSTIDLRFSWACSVNFALEQAGFEERVDHRRNDVQGFEVKSASFSEKMAQFVEAQGVESIARARSVEAHAANELYLMENPEHILVVVAARKPVFVEADIRAAFKTYLPYSVGKGGIEELVKRVLNSPDLVILEGSQTHKGEVYLTTVAQLALERETVAGALRLSQSSLNYVENNVKTMLDPRLSEDQRLAVEAMTSPARLTLVTGYAGAGKTFAIKDAARIWNTRGVEVLGGVVSGKVTQELEGFGGRVATLAQWEARWDRGELPKGPFVFFMDEAGMVGSSTWSRIQGRVEALGGKFIAVGDAAQLEPIMDTAMFAHLGKLVGDVKIDQVRRQLDAGDRQATIWLSQGGKAIAKALDHYAQKKALHFGMNSVEAVDQIAGRYFDGDFKERLALAHSNADVDALNVAIRAEGVKRGLINSAYEISIGDEANGGKALVLSPGDRVRFTKPNRDFSVAKSSFATVVSVDKAALVLRMDGTEALVQIDPRKFDAFDYGFAATVHKSQGMTVHGKVFALGSNMINRHLMDVMMSRHTQEVEFWAPKGEIDTLADLKKAAQRSSLLDLVSAASQRITGVRRFGLGVADTGVAARADFDAASVPDVTRVGLAGDAYLLGQGQRIAGLLAAEYVPGMDIINEDPRGYGVDPLKVVDDILAERSILRASDVANELSNVVAEPNTFIRLYAQAMAHPDLVVLSEEGQRGEGRIYSSQTRIALEVGVMDLAMRLGVTTGSAGALEQGQLEAAMASAALDPATATGRAVEYALWPGRLGIVEAIGSQPFEGVVRGLSEVNAALGGTQPEDRRIIAVSANAALAQRFSEASGVEGMGLYKLGGQLQRGELHLTAQDTLVVPEASGLSVDDLALVLSISERSGAKVLLHNDPSLQATGSAVRHLAARLPSVSLGGIDTLAAERRGLLGDGDVFGRAFAELAAQDVFIGSKDIEAQIEAYVARYVADGAEDKLGLVGSAEMRNRLNLAIEARLVAASGAPALMVSRGDKLASLELAAGSAVVMQRSDTLRGLEVGLRGHILSVAENGTAHVRFGAREVTFEAETQASALDYGHVLSLRGARGLRAASVHGFAGHGLRRSDLVSLLVAGEKLSIALPTDPEDGGFAYLSRAVGFADKGSVLDYGFDPAKALAAAAPAALQAETGSAEAATELEADQALALDTTQAFFKQNPAFIVGDMASRSARFGELALLAHLRKTYPAQEADPAQVDHGVWAKDILEASLRDGQVFTVGEDDIGAPIYATRVQLELEARALNGGVALAKQSLAGIDGHDVAALRDDVAYLAGAARLGLARFSDENARNRALKEVGAVWAARGYQVIVAAPSAGRAEDLAALIGKETMGASLASLQAQWQRGSLPPEDRFVVIMADASRVDSRDWGRVQERVAQMGGKLIAVRSDQALPPIGSIDCFETLAREAGAYRATRTYPQKDEAARMASAHLGEGGDAAAKAFAYYRNIGAMRFAGTEEGAMAGLARSYWSQGYGVDAAVSAEQRLAIAHSGKTASALDAAIRAEGQRLGILGEGRSYTHGGRSYKMNIGDALRTTSELSLYRLKAGDGGRVVALHNDGVEVEIPGRPETIYIFDSSMDRFAPCYASTTYVAQALQVDRSYLYATRGMDQAQFEVGMTRHRLGLEVHVSSTQLRDYDALLGAGLRTRGVDVTDIALPAAARQTIDAPDVTARVDRNGPALWRPTSFAADAHLNDRANRVAALLAMNYTPGGAVLKDDPRGYVLDPLKVVDDILAESSVLRADDVAAALSKVVAEPNTFMRLYAQAMAHPDLVVLSEEGQRGEGRIYSSLAHIRREVDLVDRVSALALAPNGFAASEAALLRASKTQHGPLSPDQQLALRHATSGSRMAMITGYAGSGKSTVMRGVREVYEAQGWNVVGAALSANAAAKLEASSGIRSYSLAGLGFAAAQNRVTLGPRSILVIDEAAMLSANDFETITDLVTKTGASLRLVGHDQQLQPRGPGAMWRAFADRVGTVTLTSVWRQHNADDRKATQNFAMGGVHAKDAVTYFAARGSVVATGEAGGLDTLFTKAVEGYLADQHEDKLLMAYRLRDVDQLNQMARAAEQARRPADAPEIGVQGANGNTVRVQAGDRIVFRSNMTKFGVTNGQFARVISVSPEALTYTVQVGKGDEANYMTLPSDGGPALDYGFATNLHKIQGDDHSSSHLVVAGGFSRSLLYVGLSRFKDDLKIYVPKDAEKAVAHLQGIAQSNTLSVSTQEAAYGFDPARSLQAAQVHYDPATDKESAASEDIAGFIARHDEAARAKSMLGSLASLFSRSDAHRGLDAGADTRAIGEVISAHMLNKGSYPGGDVLNKMTALAQSVSKEDTWVHLCKSHSSGLANNAHALARSATGCASDSAPLPEAVALARAQLVAQARHDRALALIAQNGLELLGARVKDAGGRGQDLERGPNPSRRSDSLLPIAQPIEVQQKSNRARSGYILGGGYRSPDLITMTKMSREQIAGSLVKDLLLGGAAPFSRAEAYHDHKKAVDAGLTTATIAAQPKKWIDMKHTQEKAVSLTPISDDQKAFATYLFKCDGAKWSSEHDTLAAKIGQGGTLTAKQVSTGIENFLELARSAKSVGPVDATVPAEWRERLLELVLHGGKIDQPNMQSGEEFKWATDHAFRIGSLASAPSDLLTQAPKPDWPAWKYMITMTNRDNWSDVQLTPEMMKWAGRFDDHIEQNSNVGWESANSAVAAFKKLTAEQVQDVLKDEAVPEDWKARFVERIRHRDAPTKHPSFGSLGELEWAVTTIRQQGMKLETGVKPQAFDLAKAVEMAKQQKASAPSMSFKPRW